MSTFTVVQATQFKSAMATVLDVLLSAVTVTSVTTPAKPLVVAGRHLLQSSVNVEFSVTTTSGAASSISTALAGVTGPGAVSTFQNAGLTACTAVAVSTPTVGSTAPVDATSSLLGATPSSSSSSSAAALVIKPVALFLAAAAVAVSL